MKISVVIPAYNAAATIADTLRSCLQQSLPADEIIVVDDASTDNTVNIVRGIGTGITLIQLNENKGVANARNTGWAKASGDIIAFLDSDDNWHADKLKMMRFFFENYPEYPVLVHLYSITLPSITTEWNTIIPVRKTFSALLISNPVQGSSICIRKNINEFFDPSYRYCEDHEWIMRIAHKYKGYPLIPVRLTQLPRPQLSKGGLSGDQWKMRQGEMKLYASLWRYNILLLPVIPFLMLFSFFKFLRKKLRPFSRF